MSQYYQPQQGPMYPPEQSPEADYYYDETEYEYYDEDDQGGLDNSFVQTGLAFVGGGCLVFLCMGCCLLAVAGLWLLDPGAGLVSDNPVPGSDIGLTFEEAALPTESVVNEQGLQLTLLEVNRNAALDTLPAAEGREIIIVTVELVNLGEEAASFNERDFILVNDFEEAYPPTVGAVAGALGRGTLPPGEGLEGRLVYEVLAGEQNLRLLWDAGRDSTPRYIYLE